LINQSYQKFRHLWLQDAELKCWLNAYSADSRKAFCEVRNNAIIAKYCEPKPHNWQQKHSDMTKELFPCFLM